MDGSGGKILEGAEEVGTDAADIATGGGADEWKSITFLLVIVQAILLFGLKMWMATPQIIQMLGGFHNRVPRRLSGKQPQSRTDRMWGYPMFGRLCRRQY